MQSCPRISGGVRRYSEDKQQERGRAQGSTPSPVARMPVAEQKTVLALEWITANTNARAKAFRAYIDRPTVPSARWHGRMHTILAGTREPA